MGIKLMVEIFDHWQDAGLTVGERSDLLVLAENANDGTRQTFGPVHAEYILRRAGKTAASWRVAINKLMKKKVLEYATREGRELRGHTGQSAVYRLVPLCSSPPHSGYKGHCAKPASTGGGEGHPSGDPSGLRYPADNALKGEPTEEGYPAATPGEPSDNPVGGVGYPAATEWVSAQITPTPPYPSFKTPSTTSSTSPAEVSVDEPVVAAEPTTGGGGGSDLRSLAVEITAALDYRGKPPGKKLRQTIEDRLTAALAAGWSVDGLAVVLDISGQDADYPAAVYAHRLDPDELPPTEPLAAPAARARARTGGGHKPFDCPPASAYTSSFGARGGTDERVAGWDAVKRELAGHAPYSNDTWSRPATPAETVGIPWCGDVECEPIGRMRECIDDNGLKTDEQCVKCHPVRAPW